MKAENAAPGLEPWASGTSAETAPGAEAVHLECVGKVTNRGKIPSYAFVPLKLGFRSFSTLFLVDFDSSLASHLHQHPFVLSIMLSMTLSIHSL